MSRVLLEVAVDSFEGAIAAAAAGADRLELCSRLNLGGLSPSVELFQKTRAAVSIPIAVMIRPRAGDFCYSEPELAWMREKIETFRLLRPDALVFGTLRPDGAIDLPNCKKLKECCGSSPAVFHRAWDEAPRSPGGLESLIALGFSRLLTSGSAPSARDGIAAIAAWNRQSAGRIEILPGAGISPENVAEILRATGCRQVHGTFKNCVREVRAALDQLAGIGSSASG